MTLGKRVEGHLVGHDDPPIWREPTTGHLRRQIFPMTESSAPVGLTKAELSRGAKIDYPAASYTFNQRLINCFATA